MRPKHKTSHAEYYEAILQIRPGNQEILNFVSGLIQARTDVEVTKFLELKTGYDVYLTDQKFARRGLVTQLKKKYPKAKIVLSKALYGQSKNTSRLLYRATILFRLEEDTLLEEEQ